MKNIRETSNKNLKIAKNWKERYYQKFTAATLRVVCTGRKR